MQDNWTKNQHGITAEMQPEETKQGIALVSEAGAEIVAAGVARLDFLRANRIFAAIAAFQPDLRSLSHAENTALKLHTEGKQTRPKPKRTPAEVQILR
jgi:hypothetical protein